MKLHQLVTMMLTCLTFTYNQRANSQSNFYAAAGLGVQEGVHIAGRYQIHQVQAGLSLGILPEKSKKSITYSGDIYYHFSGQSKYTKLRPWYGRSGLTARRSEDYNSTIKEGWIYLRAGRQFNFSNKIGIALDAGLSKRLYFTEQLKKPSSSWNIFDIKEWPSGSFQLFYRL